MAKLFSHHDHFHSHATVGVLVLLHFVWRFIQVCRTGTSFPPTESRVFQTACILLHVILPTLSFQLPLPLKRNTNKPMIWFEARWHSLIFATRHCVVVLGSIWGLWPNPYASHLMRFSSEWWYTLTAEILAKQIMTVLTCRCAKIVSDKYGDPKFRTTNSMPYPDNVSAKTQLVLKEGYARRQFGATALCVMGDTTSVFWALLAIQGAALLMTLVRKGLITAATYHRVYALQLQINHWIFTIRAMHGTAFWGVFFAALSSMLVFRLRVQNGFSAEQVWIIGVVMICLGWALIGDTVREFDANPLGQRIMLLVTVFDSVPFEFLPLFFGSTYQKGLLKFFHQPKEVFHPGIEKGN